MITEIINSMKPMTKRQKEVLWELVWQNKRLRKRILKELKKKEGKNDK